MSLDTYTALKASIADTIDRGDLTAVIPDFVTLCEAEMNRRIRTRLRILNTSFTINAESVAVPSDFAGTQSFEITSTDPDAQLSFVDPAKFHELRNTTYTAAGPPRVYTIIGSNFWFAPVPNVSYTAQLVYRQGIPPLASNASNWVLANHPDLYLYGSLYHAAAYLADVDAAQGYMALFEKALDSLKNEDRFVQFAAGRLNAKPSRVFGIRVFG